MATYRHKFAVQSTLPFPIDMLRYDGAHPASEGDSHIIENSVQNGTGAKRVELVRVDTQRFWTPTVGRWQSFGWEVIEFQQPEKIA